MQVVTPEVVLAWCRAQGDVPDMSKAVFEAWVSMTTSAERYATFHGLTPDRTIRGHSGPGHSQYVTDPLRSHGVHVKCHLWSEDLGRIPWQPGLRPGMTIDDLVDLAKPGLEESQVDSSWLW